MEDIVTLYAYVEDNGDGSTSIVWFNKPLEEVYDWKKDFNELEHFIDGDGLHYKQKLVFPSMQAVRDAGITHIGVM